MSHHVKFMSAEAIAISKSAPGISEHAMTGPWRVIVARKGERSNTWYFHENDHEHLKAALRKNAWDWLAIN